MYFLFLLRFISFYPLENKFNAHTHTHTHPISWRGRTRPPATPPPDPTTNGRGLSLGFLRKENRTEDERKNKKPRPRPRPFRRSHDQWARPLLGFSLVCCVSRTTKVRAFRFLSSYTHTHTHTHTHTFFFSVLFFLLFSTPAVHCNLDTCLVCIISNVCVCV